MNQGRGEANNVSRLSTSDFLWEKQFVNWVVGVQPKQVVKRNKKIPATRRSGIYMYMFGNVWDSSYSKLIKELCDRVIFLIFHPEKWWLHTKLYSSLCTRGICTVRDFSVYWKQLNWRHIYIRSTILLSFLSRATCKRLLWENVHLQSHFIIFDQFVAMLLIFALRTICFFLLEIYIIPILYLIDCYL